MIRFQICIFDILNTAPVAWNAMKERVVIRFQICIFDILNTAEAFSIATYYRL